MPDEEEHQPGDPAPATAHYEELNVFSSPTGAVVHVREGDQKKTPREFWEPSRGEVVNMGKLSCRNASDTFALSQKLAAVISRKKPRDGCGGQGGASMAGGTPSGSRIIVRYVTGATCALYAGRVDQPSIRGCQGVVAGAVLVGLRCAFPARSARQLLGLLGEPVIIGSDIQHRLLGGWITRSHRDGSGVRRHFRPSLHKGRLAHLPWNCASQPAVAPIHAM